MIWENKKVVTEENVKVGLKVLRGPDWRYGDQDKHAIYGVIQKKDKYSAGWYLVYWYNKDGQILHKNTYCCGGLEHVNDGSTTYDLCIYEEPFDIDNTLENLEKLENKLK